MNIVTTGWKYLLHILAKASIYVTKRPSCHVLQEKYRQVTDDSSEMQRCARKSKLAENQDGREAKRPEGNQGGIDDEDGNYDNDDVDVDVDVGVGGRIEGEKMRRSCPCSRHSWNRTVRRRSQIDTTSKSTRRAFFQKMRFRREFDDDAKNCCSDRENGLSSLIGLPNGEIWCAGTRSRFRCLPLPVVDIFIFSKIGGDSHSISPPDGISAPSKLLSHGAAARFVENRSGYWFI